MKTMQPSFAAGELAPSLTGRVDMAKYHTGVKTMSNFYVHRHGGSSNRPGTRIVEYALGVGRLIPFEFSVVQGYEIELTHLRMRVIKDREIILNPLNDPARYRWLASGMGGGVYYLDKATGGDPGLVSPNRMLQNEVEMTLGTITGLSAGEWAWGDQDALGYNTVYVKLSDSSDPDSKALGYVSTDVLLVTPWSASILRNIKYTQSADTMFLTHPSTPPVRLTRTSHYVWTITTHATTPSISAPGSLAAAYTGKKEAGKAITAITSANPGVVTSNGHGFAEGAYVFLSGIVGMAQLNDRIVMAKSVAANTFNLADLNGNAIDTSSFTAYSSGGTAAPPSRVISYKVSAVADTGEESVPSAAVTVTVDSPWGYGAVVNLSWAAVAGAVSYTIYKSMGGDSFGYAGFATTTSFVDNNINPDITSGPQAADSPFTGAGNYPGAVGIFQQRLQMARTNNAPQTLHASQTGLFNNFSVSSPLRDTDAIEATIASRQVNEIRHIVPMKELVLLTSQAEWIVSAAGQAGAITPTAIAFDVQSYRGSSEVPPLVIGNTVLFVQRGGNVVRDLFYNLQDDGYQGNDLSVLANHLFKNHYIVEWAYQQSPDSVVWAVRDDGVLLGFTYLREHDIWAWHQHHTDGKFISVSVIPSSIEGEPDEVYFIVERFLEDATRYVIEYLAERLPDNDLQQAYFVDCGLTWDNPKAITAITRANPGVLTATDHGLSNGDRVRINNCTGMTDLNDTWFLAANVTPHTFTLQDLAGNAIDTTAFAAYRGGGQVRRGVTTISGLKHLVGQDIKVLADGSVAAGFTLDTNGVLTLPRAYATVHVGLGYECNLETMALELAGSPGTLTGKKQTVKELLLRMEYTRGIEVGPDANHLLEMKFRNTEGYLEATRLFTGDKRIMVKDKWDRQGRVLIRQSNPLPVTVLAIIPEVDHEE